MTHPGTRRGPRGHARRGTAARVERVAECERLYYEEGLTRVEVAARMGLSRHTVGDYLSKTRALAWVGPLPELTEDERRSLPTADEFLRTKSPLADAQRYAPGAVVGLSGEFTDQVNKGMEKVGVPRLSKHQWSRGEDV